MLRWGFLQLCTASPSLASWGSSWHGAGAVPRGRVLLGSALEQRAGRAALAEFCCSFQAPSAPD